MVTEHLFIVGQHIPSGDANRLFGPLAEGETIRLLADWARVEDVAVDIGVFPSKTQARKNGFKGEIPEGWTELRIGRKNRVFILKATVPRDDR